MTTSEIVAQAERLADEYMAKLNITDEHYYKLVRDTYITAFYRFASLA